MPKSKIGSGLRNNFEPASGGAFDITIVVCTFDNYLGLYRCLLSLANLRVDNLRIEIIVVHNNQDIDALGRFIKLIDFDIDYRLISTNIVGLSRSRNIGLEYCLSPYIAYIDDDATASPDWAIELFKGLDSAANVVAAGGPVRGVWSGGRPRWMSAKYESYYSLIDYGVNSKILMESDYLMGTNMCFSVDYLKESGGFDENIGRLGHILLSNEEINVQKNIRLKNKEVLYCSNAIVDHHIDSSRMRQEWLMKRLLWQIISDCLSDKSPSSNRYTSKTPSGGSNILEACLYSAADLFEESENEDKLIERMEIWKVIIRKALGL